MQLHNKPGLTASLNHIRLRGIMNIMEVLDLKTGKIIFTTRQDVRINGDHLYSASAATSTPGIIGNHKLHRKIRHRRNRYIGGTLEFIMGPRPGKWGSNSDIVPLAEGTFSRQ